MLKSRSTIFWNYFLNQGIKGLPNQGGVFYSQAWFMYLTSWCGSMFMTSIFLCFYSCSCYNLQRNPHNASLSLSTFLLECEFMTHCVHALLDCCLVCKAKQVTQRVIEDKKRECRYKWIFLCVDHGLFLIFLVWNYHLLCLRAWGNRGKSDVAIPIKCHLCPVMAKFCVHNHYNIE